MADENTEAREPDSTEQTSEANAGQAKQASELETFAATPKPDFDELNRSISETRKQAGPEFPDLPPEEALQELVDSEEEDTGPTDPS